ncbi:MAG: hypothetical protein DRO88_12180, partial [Promethearchaeia archaeon]
IHEPVKIKPVAPETQKKNRKIMKVLIPLDGFIRNKLNWLILLKSRWTLHFYIYAKSIKSINVIILLYNYRGDLKDLRGKNCYRSITLPSKHFRANRNLIGIIGKKSSQIF